MIARLSTCLCAVTCAAFSASCSLEKRSETCLGTRVPDEGYQHVPEGTSVAYAHNPPASGNHWACWAPWRPPSRALPAERWVHNLEHGGVVLLYRCPDAVSCPEARDALMQIANSAPEAPTGGHRLLVNAWPILPTAFAAVAWDVVYSAETADPNALLCFIRAHEGAGPEDIPADPSPSVCPQSYQ